MGNTTITNFTNSGTIKSTGGVGVNIASGTTISNLKNTGTINGSDGVKVNSATLQNLENSGTIKGNNNGVKVENGGKLETLNNRGTISGGSNGVILGANGYIKELNNYKEMGPVKVDGGTLKNLNNYGTISGASGVYVLNYWNESDDPIKNIVNSGTIISTGPTTNYIPSEGLNGSILISGPFGKQIAVEKIDNQKNGGYI
ncbi:hypothetical protein EJ753_00660 [Campylobacter lari]|nr:hypothetical protein [Campylobacter lari]